MIERQEIFLELFEPLKNNLWRFCLSVSPNYEEAKDLLQETIELAYRNFESVKDKNCFLSWMFSIAVRSNYSKRNKRKNEVFLANTDYSFLTTNEGNPETQAEIRLLYEALDKLPPEQKEAIILCDIIGFPQKEAAEIQNVSLDAMKQRTRRGKIALKALLNDEISHTMLTKTLEAI